MSYPSVKSIMRIPRITREQAKIVRGLIDGSIEPRSIPGVDEELPWGGGWKMWEVILTAVDIVIGGYGVEVVEVGNRRIKYVNRGDTYDTTICCISDNYYVASWGDLYERLGG